MAGYRGRLIWRFEAEIAIYDTAATEANGAPFPSGFNPWLREPVKKADGSETRRFATHRLGVQVETEGDQFDALRMNNLGDGGATELKLVFHFQELEDNLLVDAKGRAMLVKGSRLLCVFDQDGMEVDNYAERDVVVTEAQPRSYGLSGGKRNLLLVTFRKRDTGTNKV